MKTWIFAGVSEKNDFLLYMAKVLSCSGYRVLLVDGTFQHNYAHHIGAAGQDQGIYEFSGFDVACYFRHGEDLMTWLNHSEEEAYDYWLWDVGSLDYILDHRWKEADACVWCSSFSLTNLLSDQRWLNELSRSSAWSSEIAFHQLYLNVIEDRTADSYITSIMSQVSVHWLADPIRIPWDETAAALKIDNEHTSRLRIKPLSRRYKRALAQFIQRLSDMEDHHIHKAFKQAERRRA
ncbi:hypothetical protein JJQ72_03420 [Paenibacillus sp. F411]|uniref:hypothetical protein n=1 Tax=Paenibacillus sp. F411 TaxID=2820239 RepID=UPI001AAFBA4B|nr:hypothetical protein [Paenibacillus sp. F411]MBO2943029.1 hypothetical protein [Paenibacillus sp. F411]